jgi:hypothetical protein
MAADAVITALTTTLQTEVTAGAALPADIIALSAGLVSESQIYAATVLTRRVGLLSGVNQGTYNGDDSIGKDAMRFNESVSSDAFARASIAADSDLGQIRNGIPGLSTAKLNAIATATLTRAANF